MRLDLIVDAFNNTLQLAFRVWDFISNRPKKKLKKRRLELEEQSRQAQLNGDLDELRKIRGQIEEIDRDLKSDNY